ncbi:MAG TPA: hypothetical protein PLG93_00915 [bacterium]|nr:hypothetical protein [bacterium]
MVCGDDHITLHAPGVDHFPLLSVVEKVGAEVVAMPRNNKLQGAGVQCLLDVAYGGGAPRAVGLKPLL